MKQLIKRYMRAGNRKLSTIDNEDMFAILVNGYDEDWECYQNLYVAALNSMDLGYPENYNPCKYREESRTSRHWGLSCS